MSGEELSAWLSTHSDNIKITQTMSDGTPIPSKYGNVIQPTHSSSGDEYIRTNWSDGKNGSLVRPIEFYTIFYQMAVGNNIYFVKRNVALTYRAGDTNVSGDFSSTDVNYILAYMSGTLYPVRNADGSNDVKMSKVLLDFDLNGGISSADSNLVNSYLATGKQTLNRYIPSELLPNSD